MVSGKDFPGSPLVKILGFHCRAKGSITGQGTPISCAAQQKKKKVSAEGRPCYEEQRTLACFKIIPLSKFFADLHCDNLLELQEIKVVEVWEPTSDQVPLEF